MIFLSGFVAFHVSNLFKQILCRILNNHFEHSLSSLMCGMCMKL
uniref:Uncharacterized protein n=1 Tax=Rhizophora mucronata TaxID=61149 RepID=A0A2P2QSY7_RHIMU